MREERWQRLKGLHISGTSLSAIEREIGPPYAFRRCAQDTWIKMN